MPYCLTRDEVFQFLRSKCSGSARWMEDEIGQRVVHAENWEDEICVLSYFACQLFERMLDEGIDCSSSTSILYQMRDEMWLHIQEIGPEYLEFLLQHDRSLFGSLQEALVEVQNKLSDYDYSSTLRP